MFKNAKVSPSSETTKQNLFAWSRLSDFVSCSTSVS